MSEANGWRPISTAPRDGMPVLAVVEFSKYPVVAYWCLGYWHAQWDGTPLDGDTYAEPTHWQPLPPPPEAARDD